MSGEGKVIYTGIGARATPERFLLSAMKIGQHMARKGYVLRSGAAEGASAAFEQGCDSVKGQKEIYLPWRGFNGNRSELFTVPDRAYDIMKNFNFAWETLSESAKKLQARYVLTVLGEDLRTPSRCIICYTKDGKRKDGTKRALQIAKKHNIPIFDMGRFEDEVDVMRLRFIEFLESLSLSTEGLLL